MIVDFFTADAAAASAASAAASASAGASFWDYSPRLDVRALKSLGERWDRREGREGNPRTTSPGVFPL